MGWRLYRGAKQLTECGDGTADVGFDAKRDAALYDRAGPLPQWISQALLEIGPVGGGFAQTDFD